MPWYTLLLALWLVAALIASCWLKDRIVIFSWCILSSIPLLGWLTNPIMALLWFPSVFLHEVSHALVGRIGGGRVHKISLYPRVIVQDGYWGILMGYTVLSRGEPIFAGLFSIAPLVLGNLAVALLLRFGFGIDWLRVLDYPQTVLGAFFEVIRAIVSQKSILLILLLFALGNGALPSSSDWRMGRTPWIATASMVIVVLSVTAAVLFDAVAVPHHTIRLLAILTMLAIQLTVVLIVNALAFAILWFPGTWATGHWMVRNLRQR